MAHDIKSSYIQENRKLRERERLNDIVIRELERSLFIYKINAFGMTVVSIILFFLLWSNT